ncbi:MAG: 2-C-methyl-D-erythritol 4-phosphate cytidylyltransferase [Actinomycetota bacterium]|nr:2-C-methyl-D-erythritol 4-phosphate cytidylyltransferase [Actinomycetota bacterium]
MTSGGRVAAIVPAAGRGERLGPGLPKALRLLGGAPMLVHAVRALSQARLVDVVVVAAPPDDLVSVRELLSSHEVGAEVRVVPGGASRQASVARALAELGPDVDVVLVHDAARPLAPSELADAVAAAVQGGAEAVVPALRVADTVKRVDATDRVVETLARDDLRAVQTPQGFRRHVLADAHEAALLDGHDATDDAGLVERLGAAVRVIAGSEEAFKVTRPTDLVLAEVLLARRRENRGR